MTDLGGRRENRGKMTDQEEDERKSGGRRENRGKMTDQEEDE